MSRKDWLVAVGGEKWMVTQKAREALQDRHPNKGTVQDRVEGEEKDESQTPGIPMRPGSARRRNRWRFLLNEKFRGALVGMVLVVAFITLAIFANHIAPYDPKAMNTAQRLQPPSLAHLFGTDEFGRDVFSRVVYGSRISLQIGLIATILTVFFSTLLGLIWGYYPAAENIIARIVDLWLSFPTLLLAIAVVAILGPSLQNAMLAIVASAVPGFARVVHSAVLTIRKNEYIEAAVAGGLSDGEIIFRHILPNISATVIVMGTLEFASAILMGAGLSFLGLGAQPPTPEWGAMISTGKEWLGQAWWLYTFPGVAIVLAVLGINLVGDGLRDYFDPRLKR